jgi:hypothetical protein
VDVCVTLIGLFEADNKSILLLSPIDATTDFFQVKYLTYFFPMASGDCSTGSQVNHRDFTGDTLFSGRMRGSLCRVRGEFLNICSFKEIH